MNNRQCDKAKADLRDNKVPGLMLSVGKRSKTFYLDRRVQGKPPNLAKMWDAYCDVKRKKKSLDQHAYPCNRHLAAGDCPAGEIPASSGTHPWR